MMSDIRCLDAALYRVEGTPQVSWNGRAVLSSQDCGLGDMFVALPGSRSDGHQYLKQAAAAGAAVLLVRRGTASDLQGGRLPWPTGWSLEPVTDLPLSASTILVEVDDVLVALQQLAHQRRSRYGGQVLAVTGSYGKTTTKEILYQMLPDAVATAGNLNNHIGLPVSILAADLEAQFWILEMGMNHPGELSQLGEIARPDEVIYTPLGLAHAGEAEGDWIPEAKTELLRTTAVPQRIYLPAGEDGYDCWLQDYAGEILRYGSSTAVPGSRWHVADVSEDFPSGCQAHMQYEDQRLAMHWDVPYEAFAGAVCAGLEVCASQGCNVATTRLALSCVLGNRMRVTQYTDDIWLINDGYNASPETMESGAQWCERRLQDGWNVRVVLGDMLELGVHSSRAHRDVLKRFYAISGLELRCAKPSQALEQAAAELALAIPVVDATAPASWLEELAAPGILYAKASNGVGVGNALQDFIAHREMN